MENKNWKKKITTLTGTNCLTRRLTAASSTASAASPPPHTPAMTAASRRPFEGFLCTVRMGGEITQNRDERGGFWAGIIILNFLTGCDRSVTIRFREFWPVVTGRSKLLRNSDFYRFWPVGQNRCILFWPILTGRSKKAEEIILTEYRSKFSKISVKIFYLFWRACCRSKKWKFGQNFGHKFWPTFFGHKFRSKFVLHFVVFPLN